MIPSSELSDPTVRAFVEAVNAGDREAFAATLAEDASMTDDGKERDLHDWTEREIFASNGHLEIEAQGDSGRAFTARYRNDTWGEMRTSWRFTVANGRIKRFATGQA